MVNSMDMISCVILNVVVLLCHKHSLHGKIIVYNLDVKATEHLDYKLTRCYHSAAVKLQLKIYSFNSHSCVNIAG